MPTYMPTYIGTVSCIQDDNTIKLKSGTRIKLANIDTPETELAISYLRKLIEGERVQVEEIPSDDERGRKTAHIWRVSDNLYISKAMVDAEHSEWID